MKRLIVLAAALAFSAGAAAQLYKWRDKNGHVRYGDTPPPGAEATTIRGPAAPPPAPAAEEKAEKGEKGDAKAEKKPLTPEEAFQKRRKERAEAEAKAAQARAEAEAKRNNCEQARAQLRNLQSGQRLTTVNAAGERVFIDDSTRAGMTQRAEKSVADWCS